MPVIMMSGHATIDTAVEATRICALNFLEKPISLQKLLKAVQQALSRGQEPVRALASVVRTSTATGELPHAQASGTVTSAASLMPSPPAAVTLSTSLISADSPFFTPSFELPLGRASCRDRVFQS